MTSYLKQFRRFLQNGRDKLLPGGEAVTSIAAVDMLLHNWHMGISCFDGPASHFATFSRLFVDKYQWIDDHTYQEMFALCQALSGPGPTKMHFGINVMHYGFWTGLLAFVVWSLPGALAAFGLSLAVAKVGEELPAPAYAALSGMNSATVGIMALAGVQLANKTITDTLTRSLVFLGATVGMLYSRLWFFPALIAAGGLATMFYDLRVFHRLYRKVRGRRSRRDTETDSHSIPLDEISRNATASGVEQPDLRRQNSFKKMQENSLPTAAQEVPQDSPVGDSVLSSWKVGTIIIILFITTFCAIMFLRISRPNTSRALDLFANLFLTGTIVFGGGPVLVPLLHEYVVNEGWVSPRNFLLGLALTQAFPGPKDFNLAVFLGGLAVTGSSSSLPRAAGAAIAYAAIFLPGLWLHTAMLGLWSTVRKIHAVRVCLRGVHAAAVGLVFTAVYRLFEVGYLDAQTWAGGSLGGSPWWVVIVATSFVGGMHFRLAPPVAVVLGAIMGLGWYGATRLGVQVDMSPI